MARTLIRQIIQNIIIDKHKVKTNLNDSGYFNDLVCCSSVDTTMTISSSFFLGVWGQSLSVVPQMADEADLRLECSAAVGTGDGGRCPW